MKGLQSQSTICCASMILWYVGKNTNHPSKDILEIPIYLVKRYFFMK